MRVEFYRKDTGKVVPTGDYFIFNGDEVWGDNYETAESQSSCVGFEDFITKCDEIAWRIIE